jgi:hypothetical protein
MIFYMLICCFPYYVQNVTDNNAYMRYRIYRQIFEEEGASDNVDSRLAAKFPAWFKSHVRD